MMSFLEFMFSGFWTFCGCMMLSSVVGSLLLGVVKWTVILFRGYPQKRSK